MSEIKTSIDNQHDLIIHVVSGDLTSQEMLDRLEFSYQSTPTKQILWDLTNGAWLRISGLELRGTVGKAKKYSKKGTKMALVISQKIDFGYGRMYEMYSDIAGNESEIGCFQKKRDAEKWLGVRG